MTTWADLINDGQQMLLQQHNSLVEKANAYDDEVDEYESALEKLTAQHVGLNAALFEALQKSVSENPEKYPEDWPETLQGNRDQQSEWVRSQMARRDIEPFAFDEHFNQALRDR